MPKILPIKGVAPRTAPRLLPKEYAQVADNIKPFSGEIAPWFDSAFIQAATNGVNAKSIALLSGLNAHEFMDWTGRVEFVRGPVAGDMTNRFIYTGEDIEPRVSNLDLAIAGTARPTSWYVLGVTKPDTKPALSVSGGSGATESRVYVECFVTAWGEPSGPGQATDVVSGYANGTWNLSNLAPVPINSASITGAVSAAGITTVTASSVRGLRAGEHVTHAGVLGMTDLNGSFKILSVDAANSKYTVRLTSAKAYTSGGTWTRDAPHNIAGMMRRIYRSSTGASGATSLYFVAELPVAMTAYADTIGSSALGELIPSFDYDMPPTDLRGVVAMPNGILVGYSNNNFCACEPFRIYSWPAKYQRSTPKPIMGIGTFDTTAVVTTQGEPYTISGSHPEQFSMDKVDLLEPCLSARGVVSMAFGVVYPSPNGLALVSSSGSRLVSDQLFDRDSWNALNPASIHAVAFANKYWFWYDTGTKKLGMIFDALGGEQSAYPLSIYADDAYVDESTDKLYLLRDGNLYLWEGDIENAIPFSCRSKVFVIPPGSLPGVARITADYTEIANRAKEYVANQEAIAQANAENAAMWAEGNFGGEFNGSMINSYPANGSKLKIAAMINILARKFVRFSMYVKGKLMHTREVYSDEIFGLPRKYKGPADVEFEVTGNVSVHSIEFAPTALALQREG
jgi:hypothetical protein